MLKKSCAAFCVNYANFAKVIVLNKYINLLVSHWWVGKR